MHVCQYIHRGKELFVVLYDWLAAGKRHVLKDVKLLLPSWLHQLHLTVKIAA
jgi:hypothetical protein